MNKIRIEIEMDAPLDSLILCIMKVIILTSHSLLNLLFHVSDNSTPYHLISWADFISHCKVVYKVCPIFRSITSAIIAPGNSQTLTLPGKQSSILWKKSSFFSFVNDRKQDITLQRGHRNSSGPTWRGLDTTCQQTDLPFFQQIQKDVSSYS